jgi:general secretion pathway protein G
MSEIVILVFLIAPSDDAAVRKEAKSLEGNWKVVAAERDGMKLSEEKYGVQAIVFAQVDPSAKKKPNGSMYAAIRLDPSKSPKAIVANPVEGEGKKGLRLAGVYQLDGDTLKLCLADPENAPTELKSEARPNAVLLELKRVETLPKARVLAQLTEEAKQAKARTDVKTLTTAAETYKIGTNAYPSKLEDLVKPPGGGPSFLKPDKDVLKDPWGNPYQYDPTGPKNNGKPPDIWSEGPPGKKQPIGNWEAPKERGKKE